jgi:hypothetical protein
VQFHPESILTRHGYRLLANFLERAGIPHRGDLVAMLDDDVAAQAGDTDDTATTAADTGPHWPLPT